MKRAKILPTLLLLLIFVSIPSFGQDAEIPVLNGTKIKEPNVTYLVNVKPGEHKKIKVTNGAHTQIAVRIEIISLPENGHLQLSINGEVEERNWKEGETYLFKTLDNSGKCAANIIGGEKSGQTKNEMEIRISYMVLPAGEFVKFDDKLLYLNSILISRKEKYINQPMSVLIADIDKYQLNIYEWIASGVTIGGVKVQEDKFQVIGLYFDPIVYISKHPEIKFLGIKVLLNQSYLDSELQVFLTDDDRGSWTQNSKNYLNNKIVKGLHITVYGH